MLRPGGSFWITDLVVQETVRVQELMWSRYGDYLEGLGGVEYRQKVFEYIDREDSPRPVTSSNLSHHVLHCVHYRCGITCIRSGGFVDSTDY